MMGLAVEFTFLLLVDLILALRPLHGVLRPDAQPRGSRRAQHPQLPLYMMQLYQTMLTESPPANEQRSHQEADSVTSLTARSEYSTLRGDFIN